MILTISILCVFIYGNEIIAKRIILENIML